MSEVTGGDLDQSQPYDVKQINEDIATGEQKAPSANVDADYEASKQFSVSEVDKTGEGAGAAVAATKPQFEVHQPEASSSIPETTGNPNEYREMAKDVNATSSSSTNVTDDLVKKALEKGQAGQ